VSFGVWHHEDKNNQEFLFIVVLIYFTKGLYTLEEAGYAT
jgi:hypothetical protein